MDEYENLDPIGNRSDFVIYDLPQQQTENRL